MMDTQEVLNQARRILDDARHCDDHTVVRAMAQAREFLRQYAGEKTAFYQGLSGVPTGQAAWAKPSIIGCLEAFIVHTENGLTRGLSPKRQAQLDTVSDFLGQAHAMIEDNSIHPAAPAMIIGAALEEFLRNWAEDEGLSLGSKNPSIDSYCRTLREAELISKQDVKDITSWAGIRNHAAHGEWQEISDRKRVQLMLEGVNLFMRRYGPGEETATT